MGTRGGSHHCRSERNHLAKARRNRSATLRRRDGLVALAGAEALGSPATRRGNDSVIKGQQGSSRMQAAIWVFGIRWEHFDGRGLPAAF